MAHRPGVLGWPGRAPQVVKYALSYLFAQSEFGLLCPVNMTDSCARMLGAFGSEELKARYLPHLTATEPDDALAGHAVDDRAHRRLRRGRLHHGGPARRRRAVAPLGRQVVHLGGQRRARADAGAPRRCARGHARARDVPGAEAPARRDEERVDGQPPEGQARLALDGDRRGHLRGSGRLRGGRARFGLQADDGDGQRLAPVQRDARGRHHAARPARVPRARPPARGLWPAARRAAAAAQQPALDAARRGGGGLGDPERRRAARPARRGVGRRARARAECGRRSPSTGSRCGRGT